MKSTHADDQLITGVRAGEAHTFERLFREHYAALVRFAGRYVDSGATAEDLVQQLFTDLWQRRERWSPQHGIRAYLFAATRNRALNARKRNALESDWAQEESQSTVSAMHAATPRPDELFDANELRATLAAAMALLPERCRMVMHLRWREQLSHAEIAAVMEISVKGVENQLARGLRALRLQLPGQDR